MPIGVRAPASAEYRESGIRLLTITNLMSNPKPEEPSRPLTVREAGRKGGTMTAKRYGHNHYCTIGKKGGQRVKELIERARANEQQSDGS